MQAETLNCPMCGAAASTDAPQCLYCSARLATVACPSCFGMMFLGALHCQRCGAKAQRAETATDAVRRCPRCRAEMASVALGVTTLRECARCGGLWVDAASFEQICAVREQQAAVLGAASPVPARAGGSHTAAGNVRYVPCPECAQLMNRVNFARCSGVVVDVCKGHGTWFDRDELQQIIEFIRAGGLELSRAKEKEQLADEWRRLRQEQLAAANNTGPFNVASDEGRISVVNATRDLLKILLD